MRLLAWDNELVTDCLSTESSQLDEQQERLPCNIEPDDDLEISRILPG